LIAPLLNLLSCFILLGCLAEYIPPYVIFGFLDSRRAWKDARRSRISRDGFPVALFGWFGAENCRAPLIAPLLNLLSCFSFVGLFGGIHSLIFFSTEWGWLDLETM